MGKVSSGRVKLEKKGAVSTALSPNLNKNPAEPRYKTCRVF